MLRNFERSLSGVLAHEGGFVNDPHDPGGATNKGVTIATFRRYVDKSGTIDDLKNLTTAQAATVYRKQYWDAVCGSDLPDGVDYSVFDFAVNSGSERAAKYLQTIVGAKTDGEIGPRTLAAVKATDPTVIINMLCDRRLSFLQSLPTWPRYKNGWTDRVHDVREISLEMAGKAASAPPDNPATPQPPKPQSPSAVAPAAIPDLNPTWPPVPSGPSSPLVAFGTLVKTLIRGVFS